MCDSQRDAIECAASPQFPWGYQCAASKLSNVPHFDHLGLHLPAPGVVVARLLLVPDAVATQDGGGRNADGNLPFINQLFFMSDFDLECVSY